MFQRHKPGNDDNLLGSLTQWGRLCLAWESFVGRLKLYRASGPLGWLERLWFALKAIDHIRA